MNPSRNDLALKEIDELIRRLNDHYPRESTWWEPLLDHQISRLEEEKLWIKSRPCSTASALHPRA